MEEYFDTGSLIVIIITLILFIMVLFIKGFTHDILLEAGVFLVSAKFIMMGYKNSLYIQSLANRYKEIKEMLKQK